MRLPGFPDDTRISTRPVRSSCPEPRGRPLMIGGGIIGLEMACVYDALGSRGDAWWS